jgi:hypothetical protein
MNPSNIAKLYLRIKIKQEVISMRKIKLSSIVIREQYAQSHPGEEKMAECRKFYNERKQQDRYIVINNDHILIDGYIQYLVLLEQGIDEAEVVISRRRKPKWHRKPEAALYNAPTTYIYGRHYRADNNTYSKEYVWRVPNTWIGFTDGLYIGDTIIVRTKYGNKPIEITRIEVLDKPPVDTPIRKVCKKISD